MQVESLLSTMCLLEDVLQSASSILLLGAVLLLVLHLLSSSTLQEHRKEPPGPSPLLGNLLQLDLTSLHTSLCHDSHYHDDNLVNSVTSLLLAGTDTTGTIIRWGLLLMAKYPHIQDQVQEELSRVTGSRQVLVEDRKNLPYTDAVVHEILRVSNILPLSIPHITSRDVTFQGYFIKKGTPVIPLLSSVLNDDAEWESPHTFNPNHFLDKEGQFVKRDALMLFSAGRRACPGESLAKTEVFLFLTSLLKHFRFTPPPGVTADEVDLTPAVGLPLQPSPHQLCAVCRL